MSLDHSDQSREAHALCGHGQTLSGFAGVWTRRSVLFG